MPDLGDTRVRDALQGLRLPDGTLLVASDRLSGLGIDGQRVNLSILIKPEEAATFAPLRDEVEARLRRLPGVTNAFVVLTSETASPKAAPPKLTGSAPEKADPLADVGHVIARVRVAVPRLRHVWHARMPSQLLGDGGRGARMPFARGRVPDRIMMPFVPRIGCQLTGTGARMLR